MNMHIARYALDGAIHHSELHDDGTPVGLLGSAAMHTSWHQDLFKIAPGPIPALLFARVALAVGVPLVAFTFAGQTMAGVAGGATAMFVTLCDVGITRKGRVGAMALGLVAILVGGVVGDKFGGTARADEIFVLASALLAGWVSNSHPAIASAARFGAFATAAGVGMQVTSGLAIVAIVAGGLSAIGAAHAFWLVDKGAPDQNFMDWRAGVRRALAGADAGPRFAIVYAATAALSLFAAERLGVTHAYWATLTVIMVMRREGMVSLTLVIQYMVGTLVGIPVAWVLAQASDQPVAIAAIATAVAASARIGMALNPVLGFAALNAFLVLVTDLALHGAGLPPQLLANRLYDVGIGCALVLAGTLLASGWRKAAAAA